MIVEIVPVDVRAVCIGIFLFIMNNIGGNIPILVDPVSEIYDYRTALYIFYPGMVGASKFAFFNVEGENCFKLVVRPSKLNKRSPKYLLMTLCTQLEAGNNIVFQPILPTDPSQI